MPNGNCRRQRLADRPAFTVIELLVTVSILALTTFLAFSVYNPGDSARKDGVRAQLEQLGQAIVLYNLNNPSQPFTGTTENQTVAWWTALGSDFYNDNLQDAWGSFYEHDHERGLVYSYGEDTADDLGDDDDLVYFYRPPSAYVRDRLPSPDSTVNDPTPEISSEWLFRGSTGVTTATIWIDGEAFVPSVAGTSPVTISYIPPAPLSSGAHTIRVRAEDGNGLVGRATWQFKIDTDPPVVYARQPTVGQVTGYRAFPTSVYYQDASGIRMQNGALGWPILNVNTSSSPLVPVGNYRGPDAIRTAIPGASVTAGSISIAAPSGGGWPDGSYSFDVSLTDTVGNTMPAEPWNFTVADTSAPFINVQIPDYASKLTSSSDVNQVLPGVQVDVVGATEPSAIVSMELWHPDTSGVSRWSTGVRADAFGQFRFEDVTLWSWDGVPIPTNTLKLTADDEVNPVVSMEHVVYLYDDSSNVKLVHAVATPQTTKPNEPMLFGAGATGGTTPYQFSWEFDDGYELSSVVYEPFVTDTIPGQVGSVSHTYIETGSYSVTVRVEDANGLEDSQLLSVYVGTESQNPDIKLEPVPLEIAYGIPGADKTNFNITINGKFLGSWRLKVDDAPVAGRDLRWWYTGNQNWVQFAQESLDPEAGNTLWQQAASNNFSVEWFGQDNTDYGDIWEADESPGQAPVSPYLRGDGVIDDAQVNRGFDGNNSKVPGDKHVATLEYRDAFGQTSSVTAPIILYNDTPTPSTVRVLSVNGDENSPMLFDQNFDGIWDFTSSRRVDLFIPEPPTSNNTDLWISNYPIDLHYFTEPIGVNPLTTFAFDVPGNALVNRGEVFQNLTLADGEFFDSTDGSSGWIPYRDDSLYRNWDLTADMINLGYPSASQPWIPIPPGFAVPCPDPGLMPNPGANPFYGQGKTTLDCPHNVNQGDFWNRNIPHGLALDGDGQKVVHAIFRAVGPFISTQIGSNDSSPHTSGTTSAMIYLDRTPPIAGPDGIELLDINVVRSPIGQDFVVARFGVQASDATAPAYPGSPGAIPGSGMFPRGRAIIQLPAQPDILLPYADELEVTLGTFDSLADSATGNIIVTATILYEDNLANRSTPISSTSSLSNIGLDLIQYEWTLIGAGDLYFFQATLEPDLSGVSSGLIDHPLITNETDDSGGPWDTPTWFDADQNTVPVNAIDGAVQVAETNIDPDNFPNPDDRLGVLQSVRPPTDFNFAQTGSLTGGTIEAQQTFPVEAGLCYVMQLERNQDSGEVEYVVYERARLAPTDPDCTPWQSVSNSRNGDPVARTDKVINKSAGRFNFGRLLLPRDVGAGGNNIELDRHKDLHRDDNGQFDGGEAWDQVIDLIQSNDASEFKTYTFRGVVGEFDSGTVGDIDYLVSIDNFRLRAFFVENEGWSLNDAVGPHGPFGVRLTDPGTAEPPGVLGTTPRFVKVAPFNSPDSGLPGTNFGFGPGAAGSDWWDATVIEDDPEALGGGAALGGVGGKRFRIKFADQSQGFEMITTGAVTAGGYVMFDQAGGDEWTRQVCPDTPCTLFGDFEVPAGEVPTGGLTPAGPPDGAIGHFVFKYLNNGYVYANTPATPVPVTFTSGVAQENPFELPGITPLEHSLPDLPVQLHMKWDFLAGKEGTLRLLVRYQDDYQNELGSVVKDYQVDASPPQLDDLELRGRDFNYVKTTASPAQNWTSSPNVFLWVDGQEGSDVYREFIPGDETNTPSGDITITGGNPIGCAAPDVGQGPGPGTCDPANWHLFANGMTSGIPEEEDLLLTASASEGPVTATFRFRDAFYNHVPDFTLSPPGDSIDHGPGPAVIIDAEPAITTYVYYDTMDPEISQLDFDTIDTLGNYDADEVRGATPKRVEKGGKTWINEQRPGWNFEIQDRSLCSPARCTSGLDDSGANGYLVINGSNSAPPSADFPDTIAFLRPGRYPGRSDGAPETRLFKVNATGGSSQCAETTGEDCFAAGGPMEQYAATPLDAGQVYEFNYAKFFITDNTGRGSTAQSYRSLEFGFDQVPPTINAGCITSNLDLSYVPGNSYEEMTMGINTSGYTELGSTIQVDRILVTLDNPATGSSGAVQIDEVQLFADGALVGTETIAPSVTIAANDPDNYLLFRSGLSGFVADEVRVIGSVLSGAPTLRVRLTADGGRHPVNDQTDLFLPTALPAYVNTNSLGAAWPALATCVTDQANGVGLHPTDESDGDNLAEPWERRAHTTSALGWVPGQPSTGNFNYTADPDGTYTAQLRALDRLENISTPINLFSTTIDRTPPTQATGFDVVGGDVAHTFGVGHPLNGLPITRVEASAQCAAVGVDTVPGTITHHVLRAFYPDSATLTNSLHVTEVVDCTTPFSLATYQAAGEYDGIYQFAIYAEDEGKNRQDSYGATNRFDLMVDTTAPRTTSNVTLSAPSLVVRDRLGTAAAMGGACAAPPAPGAVPCDSAWTNDPNVAVNFRVEDLAFNHAVAGHQADAGSGVDTLDFAGVHGTGGSDTVDFSDTMAATPNINGSPYTSGAPPLPHGFDVAIQPVQEFGVAGRLPAMDPVGQGKYYFEWLPTDEVSNAGTATSTYFQYDTQGPTWSGAVTSDLVVTLWDGFVGSNCSGTAYPFDLSAEGGIGADITIPTTVACVRVDYAGLAANDRASDPGAPNTGIGLDYNAARMPTGVNLYRGSITGGSGHTWGTGFPQTDNTYIEFSPPDTGSPAVNIHIRDLLGNDGDALKLFGFILDTTPPKGYIDEACGGTDCDTVLENITAWPTGSTPDETRRFNVADYADTGGVPAVCSGAGCVDTSDLIWIKGRMTDFGGGFNLNQNDSWELTFVNKVDTSPNCTFTLDAGDDSSGQVAFDIITGSSGSAENVEWYARLPKPGTGDLGSCPADQWDDHVTANPDDVRWNIVITVKDKGGNLQDNPASGDKWGSIDVRGPIAYANLDYEKSVTFTPWANEDNVDAGGWTIFGDLPATDLGGNMPELRVTNAGAAVNSIVWQTATGSVPNYQTIFSSVNVGDVENDNLRIEMRATDKYGNQTSATPVAGVHLDTVDPNPDLALRGPSSLCGASVPSDRELDILDCGDGFPDTVEFEICEDITYDNLGMQDCISGYDKIIGPQACAVGGGVEFTVDQATYLADDATLLPQNWRFRVEAVDEAGNSGYNNQGSGDEIEFGIGPPPSGTVQFTENGGQGGSWINKTQHVDSGAGLGISGDQTVNGAGTEDVLLRVTVDGALLSTWGTPGVGPAGSVGEWVSITTGPASLITNFSGFSAGIHTWTADLPPTAFPADLCAGTGIEIEAVYVGCGGSEISAIDAGGQGYRIDLSVPTVNLDGTIDTADIGTAGWYALAEGDLTVSGTVNDPDPGGNCSGFNGTVAMATRLTGITPNMTPQAPATRPSGAGTNRAWQHIFSAASLSDADFDGNADSSLEITALEDIAGNVASGLPVVATATYKVDYTRPAAPSLDSLSQGAFCLAPPGGGIDLDYTCSEPATSDIEFEECFDTIPINCTGYGPYPPWTDWQVCSGGTVNIPATYLDDASADTRYRFRARERDQAGNISSAPEYSNVLPLEWSPDPAGTIDTVETAGGNGSWIDRNDTHTGGGLDVSGSITGGTPNSVWLGIRDLGAGTVRLALTDISTWGGTHDSSTFSVTIPQAVFDTLVCAATGNELEFFAEFRTGGCNTGTDVEDNGGSGYLLDTEAPTASGVTVTNVPNGDNSWYKAGFTNMVVEANYADNSCSGTDTADAFFQNTSGSNTGATVGDGIQTINVSEGSFGAVDNESNAIPTISAITDVAGNVNGSAVPGAAVAIDVVAPASPPTLDSATPPSLCGSASAVDLAYTCGGAGHEIEIEECSDLLTNADCTSWATYQAYAACGSPETIPAGHFSTADSRYRFRAKHKDQAGNENAAFSAPLDVDYSGDPVGDITALSGWHNQDDVVSTGVTLGGQITAGSPTAVQIRVLNDVGGEVIGWTNVDSFDTTGGYPRSWSHNLSSGVLDDVCWPTGTPGTIEVQFVASGSCTTDTGSTPIVIDSKLPTASSIVVNASYAPTGTNGYFKIGDLSFGGGTRFAVDADLQGNCSAVASADADIPGWATATNPFPGGDGTQTADFVGSEITDGVEGIYTLEVSNLTDVAGNVVVGPISGASIKIDLVAPIITVDTWEESGVFPTYVNVASLADGNWDISGSFTDSNPEDTTGQNMTICFDGSSAVANNACPGGPTDGSGGAWNHSEAILATVDLESVTIRVNATDYAGNVATEATGGPAGGFDNLIPADPAAGDVDVFYGGGSGLTDQVGQAPGDMAGGAGGPLVVTQADTIDLQVTCTDCRFIANQASGDAQGAPADCNDGTAGAGGSGVWTAGVELAAGNRPGVAVRKCDAAGNPSASGANWFHIDVQP